MKIVYVYADTPKEWNCSEWRCAVPARAINRSGRHIAEMLFIQEFAHNTPLAQATCKDADIIIVQRNLFGPVLASIQHWKAHDKVVITDFDDAYHLMPSSNVSYPLWHQGIAKTVDGASVKIDPPPLTQFKWGLRLVHAGTAPSKRLADDFHNYTPMYYLPNYIDLEKYQNVIPEKHEGIVIGWGGSLSHLQSFAESGILSAIKRVCQSRPQVKFMICGSDVRVLNLLDIPSHQKFHQPWVPYSEWAQVLGKFDIGLAPLFGAYDERRSWIKVLEYMIMKIPWIASEGAAYNELRTYGWLVKNNAGAWERVLLDMIDHLESYKAEAAQDPYLFGISQGIDENVEKIIATYTEIANYGCR